MANYFKNLNTITQNLKRKIYKKKDSMLIIIMEKWEEIVGKEYYKKSNLLKITDDICFLSSSSNPSFSSNDPMIISSFMLNL